MIASDLGQYPDSLLYVKDPFNGCSVTFIWYYIFHTQTRSQVFISVIVSDHYQTDRAPV